MKKQGQPDLDLIGMVQRARMEHDADAVPSQVSAVYWIEAKREVEGAAPTPRAGRWVIFTNVREVDALWELIKAATRTGNLGYKAKVSTSARDLGKDRDDRVIHVVTYDADDAADVARVREALGALGLSENIRYERIGDVRGVS
jgi:hypothetical protein